MDRVHAGCILQIYLQRGKFYLLKWQERFTARSVRNTNFLAEDEKNCVLLRNNLSLHKNIFQYVYSNVLPEVYCTTERRGFDLKSTFHIVLKTYKDK